MKKVRSKKAEAVKKTRSKEENILRTYMREVNKIPLLKKEEEEEIALRSIQGDKAARERLVNSNLRFVIMVAKKYQGKGFPLEDLISEGNLGLVSSIDHFDASKGYRFITYAVWWIRQAIIKALHEKSRMIRLPTNKTNDLIKIEKTRQAICGEPNRKNSAEMHEIASYLDMSRARADELLQIGQEVLSLDDPGSKFDSSLSIKDYVGDESCESPIEYAISSAMKDDLERALDHLEKRDAEVIRCRFGLGDTHPMTLKEIGLLYKLSRERVRQIEKRALLQLQGPASQKKLANYIA